MALLLLASAGTARTVPVPTAGRPVEEFFEAQVRPLLAEHCWACHGEGVQQGGLRLDTERGFRAGGRRGRLVDPSRPGESLLLRALRHEGPLKMPPAGRLPDRERAVLESWIRAGAPWPRQAKSRPATTAAGHWAFRPIRRPPVPGVAAGDRAWVRNPVDAFVLAALRKRGLGPSPEADRRTLLRRVSYDLTGLPPTAAEVEAFQNDTSPDAWERVVDRLLESPAYGERWARHWLDVARYADTKGYVFFQEARFPWAWTYRDYVVRSLNEDVPYDRFVQEQLAADLLPAGDPSRLAALGFLTLGGRFMDNPHDVIDDRIDVTTRGLLGLTVTCARCHDHKFDPVPTQDYYSLYGVFASCVEPTVPPLLGPPPDTEQYRTFDRELQARAKKLADFVEGKHAELVRGGRLRAGEYLLAALATLDHPAADDFMFVGEANDLNPRMVHRWQVFLEQAKRDDHPVFRAWHALAALPPDGFPHRAAAVLERLARPGPGQGHPLVVERLRRAPLTGMPAVAAAYGDLLAETARDWEAVLTRDPKARGFGDPHRDSLREVLYGPGTPPAFPLDPQGDLDLLPDRPAQDQLRKLLRELEQWRADGPGAPPRAMALVDRPEPVEPHVFLRGNSSRLGERVPRRFLAVASGRERPVFRQGSGRLELARAITSPENPLTARVIVNRVWLHHFGAGLVSTASDFGLRTDPPSHPELLDWLAAAFMAPASARPGEPLGLGWSLKRLHRLLVTSSTYRQASRDRPEAARVDPENRLLWRANRSRLEFEALRDSLLAAAGTLDHTRGGPPVDLFSAPYPTRRSLYGFVNRDPLPGLLRVFDFPSPDSTSPRRDETVVAQQALYLLNHPFVAEQARRLAGSIPTGLPHRERVQQLYLRALARRPTPAELASVYWYLNAAPRSAPDDPPTAWSYGYGEAAPDGGATLRFQPLPHFNGEAWQGGPALPDPALSWVRLTATGGHAGNDLQHAAIRRWTAPVGGVVTITGTLSHRFEQGDGVRARLISSRRGRLGEWTVHNRSVTLTLSPEAVVPGETLDFVVDRNGTLSHDEFEWSVRIAYRGNSRAWRSSDDFRGPPLEPWERVAQTLLLSNEFLFID